MEAEWEQFALTGSVEAYLSYRQKESCPGSEETGEGLRRTTGSCGGENEGTKGWDRQ